MVEAVIGRNLDIFRSRIFVTSDIIPLEKWQYQVKIYNEKQDYTLVQDWKQLDKTYKFNTTQTIFAKMSFVPTAPKAGETAYFKLCTARACEAFVSINGKYYAGVNNDQGRNRVYLPEECYGKETLVEIELFRSRHESAEFDVEPICDCRWEIVNDELLDFSRNMNILWDARRSVKNEFTKDKLRGLLEEIIRESDASIKGEDYLKLATALNKKLKKGLDELKKYNEDLGTICCVASTHIDVAWLWQYKDTIRKSGRSALNQMRIMERYPEFEFSMSQPSVYNYIKEVYPDVFEGIKQKVKDGQWRLVGPMWVEGDLNISGAEALTREFLYGQQFFMNEFGKKSDMCWIPDSFGFPASLPQIFAKCGTKNFFTTKVRWQAGADFPYNVFVWEGIDHSQMLSTIPWDMDYYNGFINLERMKYASDHLQQKNIWDKTLFVYGFGDGGGGPVEEMVENYRRIKDYPGMPKVKLVRTEDYYKELNTKREKLPVWKGELCVETHQGTYTTIANNKRSNRYAEMAYRRLDLLASLAFLKGVENDYGEIVKNWKDVLLLQFHDVLPGSSINAVYEDTDRMYADIFKYADKEQKVLLDRVLTPKQDAEKVTVYNPNSFVSTAYVPVDKKFAGKLLTDGKNIAKVLTDDKGNCYFFAKSVEGFGTKVYSICGGESKAKAVSIKETKKGFAVKTPSFTFNVYADGTLHDFMDRRSGLPISAEGKGLNNLVTYKDGPEYEDAWNIDKEYKMRPLDMKWENKAELVENNGERAVIRVTKKHNDTVITEDIVCYAEIDRVDFNCHINWQEEYKILQVSFPVDVEAPQATYEIAYGQVKRNTHANTPHERWKHEYAAHRYVDLSDDNRGVTIVNDCKYGHNVIDNDMIMTLFRSTEFPAHFYDKGEHDYKYAIIPHNGGLAKNKIEEEAYLFNSPVVAVEGEAKNTPILALNGASFIVDCIKPAEDGKGIIVRGYEPYGIRGKVAIKLPAVATITEESPLEEKICDIAKADQFEINLKPYEIRTFRLVF